ncbi:MAG: phosphoribosyltransferase family protein [Patescibacteria group bacterium]|nr:phosphoribosyltransferase family protein [Patescibacteria group bacterium]
MFKKIINLLSKAENFILPESCLNCRRPGPALCPACRAQIQKIPALCPACGRAQSLGLFCLNCRQTHQTVSFDGIFAYAYPSDSIMSKAIRVLKYQGAKSLGRSLGKMLGRRLAIAWTQAPEAIKQREVIIIPIPLHPRRQRARGFNQSQLIATGVSKTTGWLINEGLKRKSWRQPKASSSFRHEIFAYSGELLTGKNIILVDDTFATGTTAQAAAQALKTAGADTILVAVLSQSL